jgi:protoporphyrinogen oxidase
VLNNEKKIMKKNIIVIGSGFGGLAAASRLLSKGHHVTVFEKRNKPGGRAYVYNINGFTFDGGPTVITAPFMFDDLFETAGKKERITSRLSPVILFTGFLIIMAKNLIITTIMISHSRKLKNETPPIKRDMKNLLPPPSLFLTRDLQSWPISHFSNSPIC